MNHLPKVVWYRQTECRQHARIKPSPYEQHIQPKSALALPYCLVVPQPLSQASKRTTTILSCTCTNLKLLANYDLILTIHKLYAYNNFWFYSVDGQMSGWLAGWSDVYSERGNVHSTTSSRTCALQTCKYKNMTWTREGPCTSPASQSCRMNMQDMNG